MKIHVVNKKVNQFCLIDTKRSFSWKKKNAEEKVKLQSSSDSQTVIELEVNEKQTGVVDQTH